MDKCSRIPWLNYIIRTFSDVFNLTVRDNPFCVLDIPKSELKHEFLRVSMGKRNAAIAQFSTHVFYDRYTKEEMGLSGYLKLVTIRSHQYVLTRLRMGIVHLLVAYPVMKTYTTAPCPCDGTTKQSTEHFLLLCPLYLHLRKIYLKPLFKKYNVSTIVSAMGLLFGLDSQDICFFTAVFILKSICLRKSTLFDM